MKALQVTLDRSVEDKSDHDTHRLLANNEFLHLLHLGHVVFVCLKLSFPDSLIDAHQHLSRDVLAIVHPYAQEAQTKAHG